MRILLVVACTFVSQVTAQNQMTVRVWNYAGTKISVLAAAEAEVNRAFGYPGVQLRWIHTELDRPSREQAGVQTSDELVLRVKSASPAFGAFGADVLGRAYNPQLVDIYDAEICRVARELGVPTFQMYAIAMLHEFGHVLLGPRAHESGGPMRATWERAQIHEIGRGGLRFTKAQSQRIRDAVAIRIARRETGRHSNSLSE